MFRLSICMMVKNESKNLDRCLSSLKNLRSSIDSELIIVDTGSTDDTVKIASSYTEKIYHHDWNNNFSEMRNITISYAKGEWIFIIDADEELVDDRGIIEFLKINNKKFVGASIKLDNVVGENNKIGSMLSTIRIFLNDGKFRYEGSVHNLPVLRGNVLEIPSKLLHYGYYLLDNELMEKKFKRTSELLLLELDKNPDNVYYRYQLGTTYEMYSDIVNARKHYDRAYYDIKRLNLDVANNLYMWGPYAKVLIASKAYDLAIQVCLEGLSFLPDYLDLIYFCGVGYLGLSEWENAIDFMEQYIAKLKIIDTLPIRRNPAIQFYTITAEIECRYNISQAYMVVEQWQESLNHSEWILNNGDENSQFFNSAINFFIKASTKLNSADNIIKLYEKYDKSRWDSLDDIVYSTLNDLKFDDSENSITNIFLDNLCELPSLLGVLIKSRRMKTLISDNQSSISKCILKGYDEAFYTAINMKVNLSYELMNLSEISIMKFFSSLDEKYMDFNSKIEEYLHSLDVENSVFYFNLSRIFNKFIGIKNINTKGSMSRYFDEGIRYLLSKYNVDFIMKSELLGYGNSEEQYLACLYLMVNSSIANKYKYIDKASEIFPEWQKEMLIWIDQKLENEKIDVKNNTNSDNNEMNRLKVTLINNINNLLSLNQYQEALDIVMQFLQIEANDVEMMRLKETIENNLLQ